jgi:hypothetical protein
MTHSKPSFEENQKIRDMAALVTTLEGDFFPTGTYNLFRKRVFQVLELREERLKKGITEQKGAALIGPAGVGKSHMAEQVVVEYAEWVKASGGREFGSKIVSVIVPAKATVIATCNAILRALGYPIVSSRTEDYLVTLVTIHLREHRIAALHLDEVQDSGRHKTSDSIETYAKRFRNMMQDKEWPICLIMTGTLEGRRFINHDGTLTRRLKPVEILPMTYEHEGLLLRKAVLRFLERVDLTHGGLLDQTEFIRILMHAGAYRFGMAIEIAIEAIGEAKSESASEITVDHFAEAYFVRMNCDDELNPFYTPAWKGIDTTIAMDRYLDDRKVTRKRPKSK